MESRKEFNNFSLSLHQHIARVVLDHPPVNALNKSFIAELTDAARIISTLKDIRVVTVSSALEIFCAGADLKERARYSRKDTMRLVNNIQRMILTWIRLPQTVLMQIQGAALGGGLEFALTGDIIVASSDAVLGFPEVGLGIIPGAGGTQTLQRRTSVGIAKKWILSAKKFSAQEASEDGVVDLVLSRKTFMRDYHQLEQLIASRAPLALRRAKQAINNGAHNELRKAFRTERLNYIPLIDTRDRKEALQAFIEKRSPEWVGK